MMMLHFASASDCFLQHVQRLFAQLRICAFYASLFIPEIDLLSLTL